MKSVNNKIKELRLKKGFSQQYMADMLGIEQASFSRLENSGSEIGFNRMLDIAKLLEVDITYFIDKPTETTAQEPVIEYKTPETNKNYKQTFEQFLLANTNGMKELAKGLSLINNSLTSIAEQCNKK